MGKQVLRNENLFFILSDILFAEQVSIERNNPVIVIFRHLLPLLIDTRHGLTICTQKASHVNKDSCRSQ